MTLARKMTLQIGATIAGLLLVCAAALWGVHGLRGEYGIASAGYRELREMYEVASHVAAARTQLSVNDRPAAATEIDRAMAKLDVALSREEAGSALRRSPDGARLAAAFREAIKRAAYLLRLPPNEEAFHSTPADANDAINQALGAVTAIAVEIRKTINEREQAAGARWRQTLTATLIGSGAVILCAIVLGIVQYRGVVTPLQRLRDAANTMAAGRFGDRVDAGPRGATELVELAADFNRMARELEALYRDLETKVAVKSRELARSERLASVGYLAAGVAHEINNPLGIITGYGERAIQKLERANDPDAHAVALKHLRVMCEEAYRCKAITDKLLSLARPGEETRAVLSLRPLAGEVVTLVEGLAAARDRKLTLQSGQDATVIANAGEIKQVLLNLVLNALEAVGPVGGEVTLAIEHGEGVARIVVADNGRGMTPRTLERVFEPFFTEKRGTQTAGTGLGLSISHAIIASHGGQITASSGGIGQGSQFVVVLPTADRAT